MGHRTAIHVNPAQPHQVTYGRVLAEGFKRHGISAIITFDIYQKADLHVCIGPWYALEQWKNDHTLYIDRAYWNDPLCVSVHWLWKGEKHRFKEMPEGRDHPELQPMKTGDRTIYLCDYGDKPVGTYDTVRYHPSSRAPKESLSDALNRHDIAVGKRTTALVDAHIQGLEVKTRDIHSPVYGITDRKQWICDLSWHNWSSEEITRGEMWAQLR